MNPDYVESFIMAVPTIDTQSVTLPLTGFTRAAQLLPFLPFGKTTLFKWSGEGRFPKPIKLSSTITAWRNEDVHEWFKHQGSASL